MRYNLNHYLFSDKQTHVRSRYFLKSIRLKISPQLHPFQTKHCQPATCMVSPRDVTQQLLPPVAHFQTGNSNLRTNKTNQSLEILEQTKGL